MSGTRSLLEFQQRIGMLLNGGDLTAAAAASADCRRAWPGDAAGWLLGSITALLAGDPGTALALIDDRLATDTVHVQCLLQRAECLLALGDRAASLQAATAAAGEAFDSASLDAVGEFLFHAGDFAGAVAMYDQALGVSPANPRLLAKRADVQRVLGKLDLAAEDYAAALQLAPGAPRPLKALVELRRQTAEQNSMAALESALARVAPDSTDAAVLHFGLAKVHEDLGDHERCWRHLVTGNQIERARIRYESDQDRAAIGQIMAEFPAADPVRADSTAQQPIFIVGIPRSGTTLVERIVGSHSSVHSAGEITALPDAIDALLAQGGTLGALEGASLAREYLARCRGLRGERPRFTDKLLINFLHCALILRAFPEACIVHVTRHPLAACLAIYRTRFNGTYPFAYDLTEIGEFYIGYRRLMTHWHQLFPGRIFDLRYEDVVTDIETATRRLLEYLDLPFEASCLQFQNNPAPVKTTSSAQVRQPLYDSSLNRWRQYSAELAPLAGRLEAAGILIPS